MNKYQKILTIVALVVFSAIIALHYICHYQYGGGGFGFTFPQGNNWTHVAPIIEHVQMPLFVLGVLYAGSMALTWKRRAQ